VARGNPGNLNPVRSNDEAKKRGKNGGIKSGESRRRKKAEKDSLKKILDLVPNMDIFLENPKNKATFSMLGIKEEDVPDIMTLTELKLVQLVMNGDLQSKKYIDERMGKNPALELKRQIFEQDAEIKRLNAELARRKHNVNRQRLKGEYDVDLDSGLIDDSNDCDGDGLE